MSAEPDTRGASSTPAAPPRWTPEQELAISARGSNLLVSAAAGAGKTAVLVERVVRLVLDRVAAVDRLLVVTFTEAAAAELRERLARALREALAAREGRPGPAADDEQAGWLRLQLALLGRASISTLHSFCLSVVRRYFHTLGLDPTLEVLSEEEALLLRDEVIDEVFEELYDRADPGFLALVEAYGSERDDLGLRRLVLRLHDFSRSHPDPRGWLERAVSFFTVPPDTPPEATAFGRAALEDIALSLASAADRLGSAEILTRRPGGPSAYGPAIADDILRIRTAAGTVAGQDWEAARQAVALAAAFADLPRVSGDHGDPRLKEAVRRIRDKVKRDLRSLESSLAGRTGPELIGELRALAGPMQELAALVTAFDTAYRRAKDTRGVVDFSDLEHLCLAVLTPPDGPAARELRERYAEVLVDEYQDTSEVQEAILNAVSTGANLFMVGDAKQSIYRFRLANPELFQRKYGTHRLIRPGTDDRGDPGRPRRAVLPHNFRSRRNIVEAVNFVFRQVMRSEAVELDYDEEAELRYAAAFYGPDGEAGPPVELHLLEGGVAAREAQDSSEEPSEEQAPEQAAGESGEEPWTADGPGREDGTGVRPAGGPDLEDLSVVEREAALVAARIREMLAGPEPLRVYDKAAGEYRPARCGDFAVLMRTTAGLANRVVETLARAGIPATAQLGTGYFAAPEVETIVSLLRVIDNPRQDIHLAAVLRSPVVGLDDNDLARIRLSRRPGDFYEAVLAAAADPGTVGDSVTRSLEVFLTRLESWREAARRGPLSQLVRRLYRETGLYAASGGLPGGAQRQANLRSLYDRARTFDQFSRQGLARFLRFIDRLRETGQDLGPAQPVGEGEDAVRVMSIHRAKGLEFPVVFLIHLGKKMNLADARGDLLCHRELGFGPLVVDPARRLKYPSLAHLAVASRIVREAVAEELRCLYVGMTRARDALILVGTRKNLPRALAEWCRPLTPARLAGARTYLDWVVPAVARHPEAAALRPADGEPPDAPPTGPGPSDGPARWSVTVYGLPGRPAVPSVPRPGRAPAAETAYSWQAIDLLQPLPGVRPGPLTAALSWSYPARRLTTLPAKVVPTEMRRLLGSGLEDDAAPPEGAAPSSAGEADERAPFGGLRPRFLAAGPPGPSPTERGEATHLLLQHADLGGPLDAQAFGRLGAALVDREIMTADQLRAADVQGAARFFRSDLGRWLVSRRAAVRREVPFTLALPAREVYGSCRETGAAGAGAAAPDRADGASAGGVAGAGPDDDIVLVQGIIDVLVVEPDGLTILDFKTDRVAAAEAPARAEAYRLQLDLYRRAAEAVWDRPVKASYLYFLTPGVAVRL